MKNDRYWIWLQNALGYNADLSSLMNCFSGAREVYYASEQEIASSGAFGFNRLSDSSDKIKSIKNTSLDLSDEVILYCKNHGIGILTPDDDEYPQSLRQLNNFPAVLYYRGNVSLINDYKTIAVVGTREPNQYGRKYAAEISYNLGLNNICVISGGALGVDSIAHKAAVANDFPTVMVLGTGIDSMYLPANAVLREHVFDSGLVISEYKPTMAGTIYTFPQRNRIVVALSDAVIAIQAGEKSGTLNTCKKARAMKKPVFAYDDVSKGFEGNRTLIHDGALPIADVKPVMQCLHRNCEPIIELTEQEVDEYNLMYTVAEDKKQRKNRTKDNKNTESEIPVRTFNESDFSPDAVTVYYAIKGGNVTLDEIVRKTKLKTFVVSRVLTELQLEEVIDKTVQSEYKILL